MAVEHTSRRIDAACICHNFLAPLPARELRTSWLTVENTGTTPWDPAALRVAIDLNGHRYTVVDLPHAVPCGTRVTLHWVFRTPDAPGNHVYAFSLVDERDPANVPTAIVQAPVVGAEPLAP